MNTPSESTSATLEDLPANAQPDQQIPQGEQPEGNAEPAAPAPAPETTAPDDKATPPKTETPVADKAKPSDAPADDPEKAAIERLRSDAPKAEPQKKPDAQPTAKVGEAKQPTGNAAEPKPEDGKTATSATGEGEDDPLKDWTEQERKHTKGTIKAKFRDLTTKVKELEPHAEAGRAWNEVIQAEKIREDVEVLTDTQLAWSLKSQAAAIRAVQAVQQGRAPSQTDMDILNRLRQGIAEVDRAIGYRGADPSAIGEAFTGPIPDDLMEAGEIAGLSQAEIKVLAALRAAPKGRQPAAPATSAPVPQPSAAPQQQRQTEPQQVAQQSPAEALYARKSNEAIAKVCGNAQQAAAYFDLNVSPVLEKNLRRDYPGRDPAKLFATFGPAERHQLVVEALNAHVAVRTASQPTHQSQPAGRAPMRSGGGGTGPGAPVDPEQAAIARLRSD